MNRKVILIPLTILILFSLLTATGCIIRDMSYVRKGQFMMGCAECQQNEQPVHTVKLNGFWIDRHEVTLGSYVKYLNRSYESGLVEVAEEQNGGVTIHRAYVNGYPAVYLYPTQNSEIEFGHGVFSVREQKEDFPVTVTWYGAQTYCQSHAKQLPTEAEWEYAAKGGHRSRYIEGQVNYFRYSGSDDADLVAWHRLNSSSASHPVGQKKANEVSTFDMSGNLREWVNDYYGGYSSSDGVQVNPQGPASGPGKVMRGGSWREDDIPDYVDIDLEYAIDAKRVRVTKRDFG
jgi:formylglycine-generating enzyme